MRIGQSTDIHPLVAGRKLILGGVEIPFEKGLAGHSDADVLVHAIAEAILGALALGDLGKHFPDNDPQYEGISSLLILDRVTVMMENAGYQIGNVDSTILIERPKCAPYISQMVQNIAASLHTDPQRISVKATRGEKLGFIGNEEGAVAQAIVLLQERN